jgi:hypothetical protein
MAVVRIVAIVCVIVSFFPLVACRVCTRDNSFMNTGEGGGDQVNIQVRRQLPEVKGCQMADMGFQMGFLSVHLLNRIIHTYRLAKQVGVCEATFRRIPSLPIPVPIILVQTCQW